MTARRGLTLIELIAVLAILLLLAAIVVPSIGTFQGNTRQMAVADVIRSELAIARSRAKEEGRPYRVSLSEERTRIRRAPDDPNFETTETSAQPSGSSPAVDYPLEHVTAEIIADPATNTPAPIANNGWVTLATIQTDGSCLESYALVMLKEDKQAPLYLRLRGLTTTTRIVSDPNKPISSTNGGAP